MDEWLNFNSPSVHDAQIKHQHYTQDRRAKKNLEILKSLLDEVQNPENSVAQIKKLGKVSRQIHFMRNEHAIKIAK